jgi:hypothetical protein
MFCLFLRFGHAKLFHYVQDKPDSIRMYCSHPNHNGDHQPPCSKARTISLQGGRDATVRAIKLWCLEGLACEGREDHMGSVWKGALAKAMDGSWPSHSSLDSECNAIKCWADVVAG